MELSNYLFVLLILVHGSLSAPRILSCMSYMEASSDSDEELDTYAASSATTIGPYDSKSIDVEGSIDSNSVPQRRICPSDYTYCFALWRQWDNGTARIEKQGCWKESTDRNASCSQGACTSSSPVSRNTMLYYCCCSGDVCNNNVTVVQFPPTSQIPPEASNLASSNNSENSNGFVRTLIVWCAVLIVGIIVSVMLAAFYCHRVREKAIPEEAPLAPAGPGYSSNSRNVDNINLISMLGSGKYGTVMKGLLHDQEVAVKIYPESHHQYYINERNIYSLPLMESPSLLTYFGYDERHTMEGRVEYQLVLSLAPLGCLQDWLIANTMDFDTFCSMAKSITRGLSHLHTELRRGDDVKPCIAHRDLNSRNVLIKEDYSCCIADFGFALKVFGAKYEYKGEVATAETKSINEVGTLRYMAPELLEGAVNLRDCETSLKQMDVYALGLVLWEVATRCADFYSPAQSAPPYKAPYELEVGSHPSFDQMQAFVVRRKTRPLFPAGWGGGAAAKLVKDTCEDCWDHDAEARLTSLCAEERMQEVAGLRPRSYTSAQAASPLLSANNLLSGEQSVARLSEEASGNMDIEPQPTVSGNSDVAVLFNPPPNQQLPLEKNHLLYPQQPIQPYQGRNPCQERNLAPASARLPQVLVERSKKHSFQSGDENSFSCLEDDVSVEDLLSVSRTGGAKKFNQNAHDAAASMGQGFPKQQNTDKKLRGWYGVRALIQNKLFRIDGNSGESGSFAPHLNYCDEKSNLVDNRHVTGGTIVRMQPTNATYDENRSSGDGKSETISYINDGDIQSQHRTTTALANGFYPSNRRPNNLDLSPTATNECHKSNLIHSIAEENQETLAPASIPTANVSTMESNGDVILRNSVQKRICTPSHVVPRSLSATVIKYHNNGNDHYNDSDNNNNNNSNINICKAAQKHRVSAPASTVAVTELSGTNGIKGSGSNADNSCSTAQQIRRQRSLEVFHEVFSGRGSSERLRDPSQRVKTPGDVPPSVRRVRASKTLSLYDDRMMTASSALSNHNQIL